MALRFYPARRRWPDSLAAGCGSDRGDLQPGKRPPRGLEAFQKNAGCRRGVGAIPRAGFRIEWLGVRRARLPYLWSELEASAADVSPYSRRKGGSVVLGSWLRTGSLWKFCIRLLAIAPGCPGFCPTSLFRAFNSSYIHHKVDCGPQKMGPIGSGDEGIDRLQGTVREK